ncbi:hypothetical protein JXC34_07490, partial [Candidatus Woesearchaeota archaeon]|nr:hypothetical protein [Candidatus Woesearchaeota archaeon]
SRFLSFSGFQNKGITKNYLVLCLSGALVYLVVFDLKLGRIYRTLFMAWGILIYLGFILFFWIKKEKKYLSFLVLAVLIFSAGLYVKSEEYVLFCKNSDQMSEYIKTNTDTDSLFLVPPLDLVSFKTCTDRAVVVDLTPVFTDKAAVEWNYRLREITQIGSLDKPYDQLNLDEKYHNLTEAQVKTLQEKYGFEYFITMKELEKENYTFDIVYDDERYVVYSVT